MLNEKMVEVLKIRAKLLDAARYWFNNNGYVEVNGPTIIPAIGNLSGSFDIKYFDKKAYLSQGLQPYAGTILAKLEKVYTIAPTFRAESTSDQRHLTEYWRIEIAQKSGLQTMIEFQESLIAYICHSLSMNCEAELQYMSRLAKDLAEVQTPFPRLTYDEVTALLQEDGFTIVWGQKLNWEMENHLSLKFNTPFFITEFPLSPETVMCESHPNKPELALSADLIAPEGYGEIGSGGKIVNESQLIERMEEESIPYADQIWYKNLLNVSGTNSGFVTGVERLVQWICKLSSIKETTAFPRTSDDFYP